MEPLLETITLDIEESNEILFKIKVEGLEQAPAKVRLVCEGGDVDYMFQGQPTRDEGIVQFVLPVLKNKLKEGMYLSRVEVLIHDRFFTPVSFNINFKQAVRVVAEAVRVPEKKAVPRVTVTASAPTVVRKTLPPPAPVVTEAKPAVIEAPIRPVAKPAPVVVAPKPAEKRPFAPKIPTTEKPLSRPNTLAERYARKPQVEQLDETSGEELIKELARSFVRKGSK